MNDNLMQSQMENAFDRPPDDWVVKLMGGWHKLLLFVGLLVTIPTTYWFMQRHIPDPWWYAFLAVGFVDGGALFWFETLQYRTHAAEQTIVAFVMLLLSAFGMATAFLLQVLGVTIPTEARGVLEVVIVFVILLNIAAGFAFEYFDPVRRHQRDWRAWTAHQIANQKRHEQQLAQRFMQVDGERKRLGQESDLVQVEQLLAAQRRQLEEMQAQVKRLSAGLVASEAGKHSPNGHNSNGEMLHKQAEVETVPFVVSPGETSARNTK